MRRNMIIEIHLNHNSVESGNLRHFFDKSNKSVQRLRQVDSESCSASCPAFAMQADYHWTACRNGAFFYRIYSDRIANPEQRKDLKKYMPPAQANSKHKFRLIFKFQTIKARDNFSILKIILIDFQYIKNFMA
jgi:hypothetical protein